MDPISRIAKDTGVPREVLVKVVAKTVTEHRVIINDDDPEPAEHGELVSMSEASRRASVPLGTIAGWIDDKRIRDFGNDDKRTGRIRRVDIDEVLKLAANPPKRGPRGPRRQKAWVQELSSAAS